MKRLFTIAAVCLSLCACCASVLAIGPNLVRNADFAEGGKHWDGFGTTDAKEIVTVNRAGGGRALLLSRKTEDAKVAVYQHDIRLKPQTLYRLSVTGWGSAHASVKVNPKAFRDKEFRLLSKSWATSTAPFERTADPRTMTFVFDSGMKTYSVILSCYLTGKEKGEFRIADVSLVEVESSKPDPAETVIVHLGDSITITSYLPFHQRVHRVLQETIEKELPGVKTRQLNLGVDGEWIGQLLDTKRYRKAIKENYPKIDVVIIRYGANDTRNYKVDEFKKRLRDLCATLKKDYPGVRIILGTGTWGKGLNWGNTRQYGPYWQAIREVATEEGYPLADIYKRFEKEDSEKTARVPRDLHPSPFGVCLSAEEEFRVLRGILESRKR